jgi:hypothetical protein
MSRVGTCGATAAALPPDSRGSSVVLLCILIVIVMWPDFVEATSYLRRLPDRLQVRRTARQACEDLDGEYERLLRSHR